MARDQAWLTAITRCSGASVAAAMRAASNAARRPAALISTPTTIGPLGGCVEVYPMGGETAGNTIGRMSCGVAFIMFCISLTSTTRELGDDEPIGVTRAHQ